MGRFQRGYLGRRGRGAREVWFTRFRVYDEDGSHVKRSVVIGLCSEIGVREARARQREIIARETDPESAPSKVRRKQTTFRTFVEQRFLPCKLPLWSQEYASSFESCLRCRVFPALGDIALNAVDLFACQQLLIEMGAQGYTRSYIQHVRAAIKCVFNEAVDQDYIAKSPARKLQIPRSAPKPEGNIATMEQLVGLHQRMDHPKDKALFMVACFCATRSSEIFGLPWRNCHLDESANERYLYIDQIASGGQVKDRVKTDASKAKVHLPDVAVPYLAEWKRCCSDTRPDTLVFPSTNRNGKRKRGNAMWPSEWLERKVRPHQQELGINFNVTFRVLRRSAASIMQAEGASITEVQTHLRHSSPATTSKVYIKPVPEKVKQVVNDYAAAFFAKLGPRLVK